MKIIICFASISKIGKNEYFYCIFYWSFRISKEFAHFLTNLTHFYEIYRPKIWIFTAFLPNIGFYSCKFTNFTTVNP